MNRRRSFSFADALGVVVLLFVGGGYVFATDPIDLDLNPVTGLIEAVAVSPSDGDRLRHVEDPGQGDAVVDTVVSSDPAADSRIAIKENGESWVVWQDESTLEIRYAYRDSSTKTWSAEATLSLAGEVSRAPSIVHNGDETWVAYEIEEGSGRSVEVTEVADTSGITDSPEPFPTRTVVGTSTAAGDLEITLRAEAGQVWLTWRDGPAALAWSRYNRAQGRWTAPLIQPLGLSDLAHALASVRLAALTP